MKAQPGNGYTWWKIVLGAVLMYIGLKDLLFPQTRALQAANSAQEVGMFIVSGAIILLGAWLLISGVQAGRRKSSLSK